MEAVKQGSACVGLKSKTHAVLVALKRAPSELSAYQKKVVPIDDHCAVAVAGLTADARLLCKFMRTECLNNKYGYDTPLPINRLVSMVGSKSQIPTQRYGRRPFGVGLLVAGYDSAGPHIYQTCPSANYFDCKAMSIGARSQSARTYLEKHLESYPDSSEEELVKHGLRALRDTLPNEVDLNTKNTTVAIVGADSQMKIYEDADVERYVALIEGEERSRGAGRREADAEDPPAAAEPVEPAVAEPETMDQS
ncbi:PSMA1 [Bugula neritina]|nr:PSMA1 [Bugula neritina]